MALGIFRDFFVCVRRYDEGFDEEDIIFFKYTGKQSKYTEVEEFKEANKDKCLEYDDAYDKRDELMKHET